MAFIDDFSFDVSTGNLRHVSGTTRYPVLESHVYLRSLNAAATKSGDDLLDITDLFVPSSRASDTDITLNGNVNIDATTAEFLYGGSITYSAGAERYSGLAIGGVFNANALPQAIQNNVKLTSYWGFSFSPDAAKGYACRILVKSVTGGVAIDGGRIRVQTRGYGYQYREASTLLEANESVASLGAIALDSFNSLAIGTVATYTDIVNTEGYQTVDYNNGNGAQPYYSLWTKATRTKPDVYNRIKYNSRDGTAETMYGLNGELYRGVTHDIDITPGTGLWVEPEAVSWGTGATAGTGQLLAVDTVTATATVKMYIQLLTGVAPTTNLITGAGGATGTANAVTPVALGAESVAGNYTGSWITSTGVAMAIADVGSTDSMLDLLGAPQAPPNNQNAVVTGLVVSQDYIIIGKSIDAGVSINKSENVSAAGNNIGNGTIVCSTAITNVPASGWVRISNGVGDDLYPYSSFSGSTYTLDAVTLSQSYGTGVNVYPLIIEKLAGATTESNTWVYTADTDLAGQVVDAGVSPTKPFPISGTFTATGFAVKVVRTPDA